MYHAHAMYAYYICIQQKVSKICQHQNSNWSTRLILSCASQWQKHNLRLGTDVRHSGPRLLIGQLRGTVAHFSGKEEMASDEGGACDCGFQMKQISRSSSKSP